MDKCQYLYTGPKGNGGKKGRLCNRPEAEHCTLTYRQCIDSAEPCKGKTHHSFQRTYRCPTCGSRERQAGPPPKVTKRYCDDCDGVGWYEGGRALKTTCGKCAGTGVLSA